MDDSPQTLFQSLVQLGDAVAEKIEPENLSANQFTLLATEQLRDYMQSCTFGEQDFVREMVALEEMVPQLDRDGRFGTPPITVYDNPHFVVDVYYWAHADTSIHSHAFCGAFAVLAGKTLHLVGEFEPQIRLYPHLALGQLSTSQAELLSPGDTCAIDQGPGFLHSAIHLANPTITLCVRSKGKLPGEAHQQGMQLSVMRPSMLYATVDLGGVDHPLVARKRQLLAALMRQQSDQLQGQIEVFRKSLGDEMALLNLILLFHFHLPELVRFKEILAGFALADNALEKLHQSFIERLNYIRWGNVKTPEQKLVASLLESGIGEANITELLGQLKGDQQTDITAVCAVIGELAEQQALPLELNETAMNVLMGLVLGMDKAELIDTLAEQYGYPNDAKFETEISDSVDQIKAAPIFAGLGIS
jgi:hypothetical protein